MCLGNRALASINFLNQQYSALYANAESCTKHYGTGLRPQRSEIEYGTCLYEFYGPGKQAGRNPSKNDLSCWFTFSKAPKLEFVCNHEVILYLYSKEGAYILDVTKTSSKADHEKIGEAVLAFRLDFKTHSIENIRDELIGSSVYTSNLFILDIATAQLIPSLSTIPGITDSSERERRINALSHFFTKYYLTLIKRAGHHVLHSLPDFDNLSSTSAHIDYSVISQTNNSLIAASSLYGVSVDSINTYLKGLWLQAASHIDEHGTFWSSGGKEEDGIAHYLAEHRSVWTTSDGDDVHFHLHFGPLKVQPLCKNEVVLYLDVQDVYYYIGSGFTDKETHHFSDWKIALIVSIHHRPDHEGKKHVVLELSSARFCEHLSSFRKVEGLQIDVELFSHLRQTLIQYITTSYLQIVSVAGHTSIYREGVHIHGGSTTTTTTTDYYDTDEYYESAIIENTSESVVKSEGEVEFGCTCTDVASCGHEATYISGQSQTGAVTASSLFIRWGILERQRIVSTSTLSYDHISATTQNFFNVSLKSSWQIAQKRVTSISSKTQRAITWSSAEVEQATCLAEYSVLRDGFGDELFFSANFKAPMIQLLVDEQESGIVGKGQVVLYLWLVEGHLKTLGNGKTFVKGGKEHHFKDWHVAFTVDLKLQDGKDYKKELVLDFSTAKFNQERSSVHGLLDGTDYRLIRSKREALIFYLTKHYFPTLVKAGLHILYSVTLAGLRKDISEGEAATSLTSITFQIYPFTFPGVGGKPTYLSGLYGQHSIISSRNCILFLGMAGNRPRPDPAYIYRGSAGNWVVGIGKDISQGSIAISRRSFLEGRLLKLLAGLNRSTTILPSFSGINGGEWILKLTTWGKHDIKKNEAADWTATVDRNIGASDKMEFYWLNRDNWLYEHEGRVGTNGIYSIKCNTHNTLTIPTVLKRGALSITVRGNVIIKLSYSGDSEAKKWGSTMSATWTATIVLASDAAHGGLSVTTLPAKIAPEFFGPELESSSAFGSQISNSVLAQLREQLPKVFDFGSIVEGLRSSLTGISSQFQAKNTQYVVTNPTFNQHGDLLVDLRFRQEGHQQQISRTYSETTSSQGIQRSESWFQTVKREVGEVISQTGLSVTSSSEAVSTSVQNSGTVEEKRLLSTDDISKAKANGKSNGKAAIGNGVPALPAEKA